MNYKSETYSIVNGFKVTERVLDLTEKEIQEHVKDIKKIILEINNKASNSRQIKSNSEKNINMMRE